jgi:hypothetical protein
MSGRLTLSDPLVKELAQASCAHDKYYDALPKLQGEENWQEWSDALQHAALMAGTDTVLNGEAKHPNSLEGKQCTTAEWNDNIKRTAVWRSRNESLLKAMRGATDIDISDLGASNAHDTYVGLRSKYHTSDNQRAFRCFSDDLAVCFDLESSPKEIANILQHAFDQYNQLVGDNVEQRLPENLLKMAFLHSLNSDYYDWRKSLLKERDVLALGQGSTLTFEGLVELAVIEHSQLLPEQTKTSTLELTTPRPQQQAPKRNISQVEEPAQSDLHKLCSVPHHHRGIHTNQNCWIQNPRLRPIDWNPSKDDERYLAEHPKLASLRSSNISQSDGTLQIDLRRPCSLPHHQNKKHADQQCWVQNPQLRKPNWKPKKQDRDYLAQHPEIEKPQSRDGATNEFNDDSGSGSDEASESESDGDFESESDAGSERTSEIDVEHDSESKESEEENNERDETEPLDTTDEAWERFAAARFAEVEAQKDRVIRAVGGRQELGKRAAKRAPLLDHLAGKWLLYSKEHVSRTSDQFHVQLWKAIPKKGKRGTRSCEGSLIIESHGCSKTFEISNFTPPHRVSGHPLTVQTKGPVGKRHEWKLEFWGNGKMLVSLPPILLGVTDRNVSCFEFAGLRSNRVAKLPVAGIHTGTSRSDEVGRVEATVGYDRIIRTGSGTGVAVKVEQDDSDMILDDGNQDSTAMDIKAEGSASDDSEDERADDIAATMDTVQKQKDALRGGLIVPLRDLPGMRYFHSPDYKQEPGQLIRISFYDRVEHGPAERMCAPGHCKPSTDQIHYCGELRFKAKEGERDWSCLIKQFDVPKQASVIPLRIQSWDALSKRVVFITAWFLGGDAMCVSLPTTYIPNYQGQKTLITFSGVKRG